MAKRTQVYKCNLCGNITEVLHAGPGQMVCCNKPMELLEENVTDGAVEKHVPVIEKKDGVVTVKVGSVNHPMEEKHYIEWIEIVADNIVYREHLNPGDEPIARFKTDLDNFTVREYCNLHGLWKAEN